MHEQWKILLDEKFIQAYRHGFVVTCHDGVRRRFYPRIFAYIADYPERYTTLPRLSVIIRYLIRILFGF